LARLFARLVRRAAGLSAKACLKAQDVQQHEPAVTCAVERTAESAPVLNSQDQQQLAGRRLKFILFLGPGDVPRGLPACAELGVWRFTQSSGPAKEYPFIDGLSRRDDVVSFGLEQISGDEGHRRLLLNGHFRARGERNRSVTTQILSEASRWPLRVLKHVRFNGDLPRSPENANVPSGRNSAVTLLLTLLLRDIAVRLTSKLASFFVLEKWTVGFARMDIRALLAGAPLTNAVLLPRLGFGRFLADPFILSTTPLLTLLAEDYSDLDGLGRISQVTVKDPFGSPQVGTKVCLESRHHLSYPFLFTVDGTTYCLPECHQSNSSRLYRYDAGKLTPVTDLIPGARITDGTVLLHEGRYWLFCGLEDDNDQVNLYLFFSETLHGTWSPHPLNPVKTDVRSSRSAGPIILLDGAMYRPAQDCSRSYGSGLSINRIERLTVDCFEETLVTTIGPEAISRSCKGLHTLSFADDVLVIDAKFHLVGLEPILVRILRRIKRMRAGASRAIRSPSQSA
jgi:hypothetical protein